MDQSTQVNFPVIPKNQHRKMWRHNTSADLFDSHKSTASLHNSWYQLRPISSRPKSLNLTHQPIETINRKVAYLEGTVSRLTPPAYGEAPSGTISRERTPPFSCNSSITSNMGLAAFRSLPYIPPKSNTPNKMRDDESSGSSKCCCKCADVEAQKNCTNLFTNTKEGLSWRRLHMSRAKLKATATTSELLSGFAMIAMVELQINTPTNVPEWLFVLFAVCTTVLVSVHIFALMISTYILPNIEAIAKLEICEMVTESPHERMKGFIEIAWAFSTILGLFLFLIEIAILCWVKFWDYSFTAAMASTVIVIPVLITFVLFAAHFYHSLVVYKCDTSSSDMEKLEDIKKHLDHITV
nr:unnamed protein product [Callosobruchus analis]